MRGSIWGLNWGFVVVVVVVLGLLVIWGLVDVVVVVLGLFVGLFV